MGRVRTVEEHQKIVRDLVAPRQPVELALPEAAGLVLTDDIRAGLPLPQFDNSAMDGYAVRASEIASASAESPVVLPVAEDIPAGRGDELVLRPGTAHRIMTGAALPAGADAVVPVELTDGGTDRVAIRQPRPAGASVRRAGEDVAVGERVLWAGQQLGAAQLALLAALGRPTAPVVPPPRVIVLSTGSELVAPGQPLRYGQIYESNGVMLAAAIRAAGAHAEQVQFIPDDVEQLLTALGGLTARADVLVTSGGVSAGAYEVVKDALADRGVEFVKVAMQPGMPQGAGTVDGTAVISLPGNPVSSLVSFEVFLRPALRAAMRLPQAERRRLRVTLAERVDSPPGRRQFRRGVLDRASQSVRAIGPPGSHFLRWLARADCLLDIGEDVTEVAAGAEVEVWELD
jgi:molybdopterin molybdotransferase